MRTFTPEEVQTLVEKIGINYIYGDGEMLSPARMARLLMDEVDRVQRGIIDNETVSIMLGSAALLISFAAEQMSEDEARVEMLLKASKSKYLRIWYTDGC